MRKSILSGILAVACQTAAVDAFEGGIVIYNYQAPYNPVIWDSAIPVIGESAVRSSQGVQLSLWYGEGILAEDQLTESVSCAWNLSSELSGYAGFYRIAPSGVLSLPEWEPGETYTFQMRAFGNSAYGPVNETLSRSDLWVEQQNIYNISGHPPGLPGLSTYSVGFTVLVPEPSSLALSGLAFAGLLIRGSRQSRHRPSEI